MSTNNLTIVVSGIPVQVVRKDIKNLHVGVYPPNGRVRVASPVRLSDETIRLAVVTRLGWIRRQQKGFQQQERQSAREMVSGESHYVQGRRYRLEVVEAEGPCGVRLRGNRRLELKVRPGASREERERTLNKWYRGFLRDRLSGLISQWESHVGVQVADWGIRKMKTRWGTCNQTARRIWINLELAKKSVPCLEFIVVHELVHILERHHNDCFRAHMDRLLPHWLATRDELNRAPLGQERWDY
jgi:predicted metal-dependent hydrolase